MILHNNIGGIQVDGIIKGSLKAKIKRTNYNIESGAEITDHSIIEPIVVEVKGAIANIVLNKTINPYVAGVASNFTESGVLTKILGYAGTIDGFSKNRQPKRSTLGMYEFLKTIFARQTTNLTVDGVTIKNMIMESFERSFSVKDENLLLIDCTLSELRTVDRLKGNRSFYVSKDAAPESQLELATNKVIGAITAKVATSVFADALGAIKGT